jgi:hypothetical protein
MRWAGNVAFIGQKKISYRILVRTREGRTPLERSRNRWKYNIEIFSRETECVGMEWIHLA